MDLPTPDVITSIPVEVCTEWVENLSATVPVYHSKTGACTYAPSPTPKPTAAPPAAPAPAKAGSDIIIIWDQPPVTGPYTYMFFKVAPGDQRSLAGPGCNEGPASWTQANDPVNGDAGIGNNGKPYGTNRVDKIRAKGQSLSIDQRQSPGLLDLPDNCGYNDFGNGIPIAIKCVGTHDGTTTCRAPTDDERNKITPENGKCSGAPEIDNVRMLVAVSYFVCHRYITYVNQL